MDSKPSENGMLVRWVTRQEDPINAKYVEEKILPHIGNNDPVTLENVEGVQGTPDYLVTICRNGAPLHYKDETVQIQRVKPGKIPEFRVAKGKPIRIKSYLLRPLHK